MVTLLWWKKYSTESKLQSTCAFIGTMDRTGPLKRRLPVLGLQFPLHLNSRWLGSYQALQSQLPTVQSGKNENSNLRVPEKSQMKLQRITARECQWNESDWILNPSIWIQWTSVVRIFIIRARPSCCWLNISVLTFKCGIRKDSLTLTCIWSELLFCCLVNSYSVPKLISIWNWLICET